MEEEDTHDAYSVNDTSTPQSSSSSPLLPPPPLVRRNTRRYRTNSSRQSGSTMSVTPIQNFQNRNTIVLTHDQDEDDDDDESSETPLDGRSLSELFESLESIDYSPTSTSNMGRISVSSLLGNRLRTTTRRNVILNSTGLFSDLDFSSTQPVSLNNETIQTESQQVPISMVWRNMVNLVDRYVLHDIENEIFDAVANESLQSYESKTIDKNENRHLVDFHERLFSKNKDTLERCFICYEEWKDENECVIELKCNHIFHKSCIEEAVTYQPKCPLCREKIETSLL